MSCPRKYYLDNICKFGDEELEIIKYLEDIKDLSEIRGFANSFEEADFLAENGFKHKYH